MNQSSGALHRAHRAYRTRGSTPRAMSPLRRVLRVTAAAIMACGGVFLLFTSTASASTVNGVATIADGSTDATLASGGSSAVFTVNLPSGAACDGDSATGGYLVDSYLVPEGTSVAGLTFVGGVPSAGYGLVDESATYYGGANTAITTGQIISIPSDLQWSPLVTVDNLLSTLLSSGTTPGVWEAGIACANSSGALVDNWNTEVTFTASSSDPNGFTWSAVPGVPSTTGTTTTTTGAGGTTTTTTGGSTSTTTGGSTTTTTTDGTTSTTTGGTTTTTGAGATTTTNPGTTSSTDPSSVNAAAGVAGSSGTTGSSGSTGSGTSGGVLAFTGMPASVVKILGMGLLVVGIGLMLLAGTGERNGLGALWALRRRAR